MRDSISKRKYSLLLQNHRGGGKQKSKLKKGNLVRKDGDTYTEQSTETTDNPAVVTKRKEVEVPFYI